MNYFIMLHYLLELLKQIMFFFRYFLYSLKMRICSFLEKYHDLRITLGGKRHIIRCFSYEASICEKLLQANENTAFGSLT